MNIVKKAHHALPVIASVAAAILPATVRGEEPVQIGNDIVVTAQRRSERLQDVPVSVTALSADQIARQRIDKLDNLVSTVPNLQRIPTLGDNVPIFSLRGVSMSDYSLNQEGPVALYYDEVYKGTAALFGLGMYDVERVEVLRGPQGTLYGKNTTGGAVNIISRKPGFTTEGYVTAGVGNYNRHELDAAVQTPLSDSIAVRLAGTFARADGYLRNRLPGGNDASGTRQWGLRASLLFKPSDRFDLLLRASTSLQNPYNYGVIGLGTIGGDFYAAYNSPTYNRGTLANDETEANGIRRRRARTHSVSATANWKVVPAVTLVSITSWDKGWLFSPEDSDGSPRMVFEADYDGRSEQFAQDLRLVTSFEGPFNMTLGAYYNRSSVFNSTDNRILLDIDANGDGRLDGQDCLVDFFTACRYRNAFDQTKTSKAAYVDARLALTSRLTLRGGLRYTHDRGKLRNFLSQILGSDGTVIANVIPGDPDNLFATTARDFSTSNVSGKIGLDYKTAGGQLLYLSYSTGYRGDSFNAQATFSPDELSLARPEKIRAFEAGVKTQFLDRRLTLNLSAFLYFYRDMQFIDSNPDTAVSRLSNLDKVRIHGGEVEIIARPTDRLTLSGGAGLLYSRVTDGSLSGVDLAGNQLFNAPHLTMNATADWTLAQGDWGNLAAQASANYVAHQYYDIFNSDAFSQGAYAIANGRFTFTAPASRWSIAAWVKNITNRFVYTYRAPTNIFGFQYNLRNEPRTFGASINYTF